MNNQALPLPLPTSLPDRSALLLRQREERRVGWRAMATTMILAGLFSLVSYQLVQLQWVRHESLTKSALARCCPPPEIIVACRGTIFDRMGEPLAQDRPSYRLLINKRHLADKEVAMRSLARINNMKLKQANDYLPPEQRVAEYKKEVYQLMARLLHVKEEEITQRIENDTKKEFQLEYSIAALDEPTWREELSSRRIRGVELQKAYDRDYALANRATLMLGYMKKEDKKDEKTGVAGVEGSMNRWLSGQDGKRTYYQDVSGREIEREESTLVPAKSGMDVHLSVDIFLQDKVEEIVEKYNRELRPERLTVILGNPQTGEIYAMASRPQFDRNDAKATWGADSAIAASYEPGSIVKLITYSAALDQGKVGLSTTLNTENGRFRIPNTGKAKVMLTDDHGAAELTVKQSLTKSSNIGTYKLAKYYLNMENFNAYVNAYGFGKKTGVQLLGEVTGKVPPYPWNPTDESRLPIGYALKITPLQAWCMLNVVANGGNLLKPIIVSKKTNHEGKVEETFPTEVVRRVISEKAARMTTEAMIDVTRKGGTGVLGGFPGFTVAAKTGTARRYSTETNRYEPNQYTVSFIGFLPAHAPRLSAVVMIDHPKVDKAYGGRIAGPIFRAVMEKATERLHIEREHEPTPEEIKLADSSTPTAASAAPVPPPAKLRKLPPSAKKNSTASR